VPLGRDMACAGAAEWANAMRTPSPSECVWVGTLRYLCGRGSLNWSLGISAFRWSDSGSWSQRSALREVEHGKL